MDYEKKYKEALSKAKDNYNAADSADINVNSFKATLIDLFPELKESEDERIKKTLIRFFKNQYSNETEMYDGTVTVGKALAWLKKQGTPNPYSGVSFEYHGHTWGMCARDNGVEIGIDSELKAFVSLDKSFISEQKSAWSEDDGKQLDSVLNDLKQGIIPDSDDINWLKSLKDRYTWKPSEEQMEVLLSEVKGWVKGCHKQIVLESLYNDLKKLREK